MLLSYLLVWGLTLGAAAITVVCGLSGVVRGLLPLRLSPAATAPPSPGGVAGLVVHNLPVCGWPLLLPATGAAETAKRRLLGHSLLAGSLAANTILVGAALGAYGTRLLAFTPQLPLEWLALAAGAAGWLAPAVRVDARLRVRAAALVAAAVLAAAVCETYAVPHANPRGGHSATPLDTQQTNKPR